MCTTFNKGYKCGQNLSQMYSVVFYRIVICNILNSYLIFECLLLCSVGRLADVPPVWGAEGGK